MKFSWLSRPPLLSKRRAKEGIDSEIQEEESGKGKKKGTKKSTKRRFKFPSNNYWLKTEEEIREILPDYGHYLDEAMRTLRSLQTSAM